MVLVYPRVLYPETFLPHLSLALDRDALVTDYASDNCVCSSSVLVLPVLIRYRQFNFLSPRFPPFDLQLNIMLDSPLLMR